MLVTDYITFWIKKYMPIQITTSFKRRRRIHRLNKNICYRHLSIYMYHAKFVLNIIFYVDGCYYSMNKSLILLMQVSANMNSILFNLHVLHLDTLFRYSIIVCTWSNCENKLDHERIIVEFIEEFKLPFSLLNLLLRTNAK